MFSTAIKRMHSTATRLAGGLQGVMLSLAVLSTVPAQAAPPAGTVIQNQAEATFSTPTNPAGSVSSNIVDAQIVVASGITLVSDRTVQGTLGGDVRFPHVLRNLGGDPVQVHLEFSNLTSDGYDLGDLQLFIDLNGNGSIDPGEPEVSQGEVIDLSGGESVALILRGKVPAAVTSTLPARARILATSLSGGSAQVTDTVNLNLVSPPTPPPPMPPVLTKGASTAQSKPGEEFEYSLGLFTGSGWSPKAVTVNGATRYLLLVRDPLPAQTQLVSVGNTPATQVLYQLPSMASDQYISAPPAGLKEINAIAVALLYRQDSKDMSFALRVRVNENATGKITNVGYFEGTTETGGPGNLPSNPVVVKLPGPQPPSLQKTAAPAEVVAGGQVDYQLTLLAGGGAWESKKVTVDGQVQNQIIVRDALPANTQLVEVTTGSNARVLYQLNGMAQDQYQTAPPADLSQVRTIAFGFGSALTPNSSVVFNLKVRVSEDATGKISNIGYVEGTNENGVPDRVPSNPAVVTVIKPVAPNLVKSAATGTSTPGGIVRYSLSLSTGQGWTGQTVAVDGQPRTLIVVRDPMPANTTFAGVVQSGGAQVLYQTYGATAGGYQSKLPADLSQVSAIAFGFESLPSNSNISLSFDLRMGEFAGGTVRNVGYIDVTDSDGKPNPIPTNPVDVQVPGRPPVLEYRDDDLTREVTVSGSSRPLNLWAAAAACNLNPGLIETYAVFLHSQISNDDEGPLQITETGPNTGVFTVVGIPTQRWPDSTQVSSDRIIQAGLNDTVEARMQCNGQNLDATILIDPVGIVFDSSTGEPIKGATVTLYIVNPDGSLTPARPLEYDGSSYPNSVLTGTDGVYEFPVIPSGNYQYLVDPPNGYRFSSQIPVAQQPPGRIIGEGSFGDTFPVGDRNPVQDIPLDPIPMVGLSLEKEGARDTVEVGETLQYTLRVRNGTDQTVPDVVIEDKLPAGFTYMSGSTRLDKVTTDDPRGAPGPKLVFTVGDIAPDAVVTLTYVVRIGAGALAGDGINTAQARSPRADSNIARFAAEVQPGVFSDEAFILGKVFVDCNRDDLQGDEEPGIPGVRMYLDDGTYVITDVEGKYSFYGVSPRTHNLKLDRITLPRGAEMSTVSNRNAGDPTSRFVDLKKGELHRADFAEGSCTPDVIAEIKRRREAGEVAATRLDDTALLAHDRVENVPLYDPRTRPAAGRVDANGKIIAETPLLSAPLSNVEVPRTVISPLGAAPVAAAPTISLEKILPELKDNQFRFLDLKDGDTLAGTDISVRIMGRDGAVFRLFVEDEEVSTGRVGQKARMPTRQVQAWEYVAIKLKPGVNRLRAEVLDGFGNVREKSEISVTAPGTPGQLKFVLPPDGAVADGQTPASILVRLLDANGVAVTARTLVTLETTVGRWDVNDLDPERPGIQTFIQGGEALFDLVPPAEPGNADLRVTSGILEDSDRLALNPFLRPLVASGIIEGAVGFNKIDADAMVAVTPEDAFEKDIERINGGSAEGTAVGARGSMFLKGKVKGDYLLTLAYDSDKDTRDRLFRDIEPERFYPIYGDSSIKGFDAQSTSPLYVRIDKGRSYLLYGDFTTNGNREQNQARQLTSYVRSLTGVQGHVERGKVTMNLFASRDARRQQINEFRAEGISGPYRLPGNGFLRNSEKVEIITRNREQLSLVIDTQPLTRYVDYTIDELDGSIIFTRPISGIDSELNPVFIRVTWEVDNGGKEFWVYGADGSYRLTDFLEVGASVVREDDPGAANALYGVNATLKLAKDSLVTVEVARSERDVAPSDEAWRAEWTHRQSATESRAYIADSGEDFYNPSAVISPGRREAGINTALRMSDRLRVGVEGLSSESKKDESRRQGIFLKAEYAITKNVSGSVGVRYSEDDRAASAAAPEAAGAADREVTSINAKFGWSPEFLPKGKAYIEYEQDIEAADNRMLGVGGDYQISQRSRLYARHELISSLNGPFGLSELNKEQNTTVFGLDYDYLENSNAFSEYRVRDAISGQEAQAAVGLRNGWSLNPKLRLTTQFERVQAIEGLARENTAVAIGLQYVGDPLTKAGTRLEWRQSKTETSILNTVALARKLTMDWSFLGKNTISMTERDGSDDGNQSLIRDRLRLGLAWRQTDTNRWNWLGRYEMRFDRDDDQDTRRTAHVLSSHVNFQPNRDWVLSGRYAFKGVLEDSYGLDSSYVGHLVSGRVTYDITERWDAGLMVSTLWDRGSRQYGVGAELGYLITSNLWFSGGYNLQGYSDEDFEDADYTRQGPYVRLRFKFDEEWLRWME